MQSQLYAREGVDLDRSTLAGWVGAASELLVPLVDQISKHVLAGAKIHADDTPIPVLAPGNGKTKTGRLWTYVRDDLPAGLKDRSSLNKCPLKNKWTLRPQTITPGQQGNVTRLPESRLPSCRLSCFA